MVNGPSDLIFEALCFRYGSTTNITRIMTRQELQAATGLPAEALVDALLALVGSNADPDKITLGPARVRRCEDMGKSI